MEKCENKKYTTNNWYSMVLIFGLKGKAVFKIVMTLGLNSLHGLKLKPRNHCL